MESLLLVVVGVLALGLPHSSSKDRRRFWHPWIDNGLAPFLLGAVLIPVIFSTLDADVIANVDESLRAILIIALTAAGLLSGTQLRVAYLNRAGPNFLIKHTLQALGQGVLVFVPVLLLLFFFTDLAIIEVIGSSLILSAFAMASSQRPMKSAIFARHRSVILNHVVPAGWWNLLALIFGAIGVALCIVPAYVAETNIGVTWLIWLGIPILLGVSLGRLASKAHNRDEAYVFLLAIIAICGGVTIAKGGSPLLGGLLLGAAFVNISLGRSAMVERVIEDLEQPLVLASGLFAGLCLHIQPQEWDWTWFGIAALVILLRMLYRRYLSPTGSQVSTKGERILASPGATGVLFLGCLVLIPNSVGVIQLLQPFILTLFALTLVDEWWGSVALARYQRPASLRSS